MKVTNFRKYQESPFLELKGINCFVGTNGSGKSTMVKAYLLVYLYLKSNNTTIDSVIITTKPVFL